MQATLSAPISLPELTRALHELVANKALSSDGITMEFYKVMWPLIKPEYYNMIHAAISKGELSAGLTKGLIALLHKGGERATLNNWRPITLLNVTYKIFAKALQIRLQPIFGEIIHPDQSAFLPMHFILDNILLTHETIHYAKQSAQPLIFLKLDLSKAYDRVDLNCLFVAMSVMGFPP
jgi:hypothetical protein